MAEAPRLRSVAVHLERLADAVVGLAAEATWVVLAGSLPPGAPAAWYAELVVRLRGTAARVAVDTSEAPLAALAAALPGAAPDLMKPNGEELATIVGADPVALEGDPAAVDPADYWDFTALEAAKAAN